MARMTEYHDDPNYIVGTRIEYCGVLTDSEGDVLPIVDAFCQGYAEAILFANAYREVPCDDPSAHRWGCVCVEPDENAQYAYQSPGKWWEGIGIDFTDAIDFLASNFDALASIAGGEWLERPYSLAYTSQASYWDTFNRHGHDFAFTRNHHGAGFWDRGYGEVGDRLTEAAEAYGEHSILTDDGPTVTTL